MNTIGRFERSWRNLFAAQSEPEPWVMVSSVLVPELLRALVVLAAGHTRPGAGGRVREWRVGGGLWFEQFAAEWEGAPSGQRLFEQRLHEVVFLTVMSAPVRSEAPVRHGAGPGEQFLNFYINIDTVINTQYLEKANFHTLSESLLRHINRHLNNCQHFHWSLVLRIFRYIT